MILKRNLKINRNVTMKVRMTNDLFIKMLLDVQMYPFWFVSQKRTCLGTLAVRGVTFIECGMRSLSLYVSNRNYAVCLGSGAATRAFQNSLPMSNSLNEEEVEAITSILWLDFCRSALATGPYICSNFRLKPVTKLTAWMRAEVVDDSLALSQNYDSQVLEILGKNDFVKLLALHHK